MLPPAVLRYRRSTSILAQSPQMDPMDTQAEDSHISSPATLDDAGATSRQKATPIRYFGASMAAVSSSKSLTIAKTKSALGRGPFPYIYPHFVDLKICWSRLGTKHQHASTVKRRICSG